jgi:monoamine oxidase
MGFPLTVDYFYLEKVPILVAFNTGSHALTLETLTDDQIAAQMLGVLRMVQGGPIPDPTEIVITRWGRDPFSNGSYSFLPVGSSPSDQDTYGQPVGGRILFAGEATSVDRYGYADGALSTGIREAKRLLGAPKVQLRAYRTALDYLR